MKKKATVELRTNGTLPLAWWVTPRGKEFETDAKIIPPPASFTVRAYKNYCATVIKKYKLSVKIMFRKGPSNTLLCKIDNDAEETLYAPSAGQIPRRLIKNKKV